MMNESALRMQLHDVSLYVVHVLLKSKVGTLADQLNVICFSNISIISDSYLSNKFGIMSGTLFSLMDSGAVVSRYNDGTEYKGMSACKSRYFCHLGQSIFQSSPEFAGAIEGARVGMVVVGAVVGTRRTKKT